MQRFRKADTMQAADHLLADSCHARQDEAKTGRGLPGRSFEIGPLPDSLLEV